MAKGIEIDELCPTCGGVRRDSLLKGLCPVCLIAHCRPQPNAAINPGPGSNLSSSGELVPGSRLGDYEILEELDRGGMGIVYRAYQHGLAREVAIKVLPRAHRATDDEIARFCAEAEVAANLSHPHIVGIYEISQIGPVHFFSMQLIRGKNLADPLHGPRFRPGDPRPGESSHEQQVRIARLMVTVALAIHYAHQRGLLHRDLKPKNILIDHEGNPYVSDFGLARRLKTRTGMTLTGGLLGTPEYMSPEQAESPSRVREATDIYSLGIILYELLTHRPPFVGATPMDTVALAREQEPAPLRTSARPVEPDLETICLKCIRKFPNERYSSALALAEDLERFIDGHPIQARPASQLERFWKWTQRNPLVASLAAGLVFLMVTTSLVLSILTARLSINSVRLENSNRDARFQLANSDRRAHAFLHKEARMEALRAVADSQKDSAVNSAIEELFTHDYSTNSSARIHSNEGEEIIFSPHFRFFARISNERPVTIHETDHATGAPVWKKAVTMDVQRVYFAPNERSVAVVYSNGMAEFVDLERAVVLFTASKVGVVTFSSDSRIALTASYDRQHRFIEMETGRTMESKQLPSFRPNQIIFDPDSESDVVGGLGAHGASFWNWKTGLPVHRIDYSATPLCLAWVGDEFFVGFENGEIENWNLRSGFHRRFVGHQRGVNRIEVSLDGRWLLSNSEDQESILWNVTDASVDLHAMDSRITQLRDDGMAVVHRKIGAQPGDRDWMVSPALPAKGLVDVGLRDNGSDRVRGLTFNPAGNTLLATRQAGVHQLTSESTVSPVFLPHFGTVGAAFTPDHEELFIAGRRELTWLRPDSHTDETVFHATLPPRDGRWFSYGSASTNGLYCLPDASGVVLVIDLVGRQVIRELPIPKVYRVGLSPSGRLMATTRFHAESTELWDISTTNHQQRSQIAGSRVAFSPDEKWLAATTQNGFDIHPMGKGGQPHFIPHDSDQMAPATFSPNGAMLAARAERGGISLISAQGWTNILVLRDQAAFSPTELAFSHDNRYLAAGTSGGMVRIWDLEEIGNYLADLNLRRWPATVHTSSEEFPSNGPLHSTPWQSVFRNGPAPPSTPPIEETPDLSPHQISLANYANGTITRQLTGFPRTPGHFNGILFDTRHLVQLSSREPDISGQGLSNSASAIPIRQTCQKIHFLGNLNNAFSSIPSLTPGAYLHVHYEDGRTVSVPIRTEAAFADWWENPWNVDDLHRTNIVWRGFNRSSEDNDKGIRVNLYSWTNPLPSQKIETIDLESAHEVPSLFVVGITVEP